MKNIWKIINKTKWQNCSQCLHRRENKVKLENDYVLVSTPSGIHSHKPPLWPLLRNFGLLQTDDQCLEIFGRYLLPNTVTVGNQCLLFQDKDVFFSWTKHYIRKSFQTWHTKITVFRLMAIKLRIFTVKVPHA